LPEHRARALLDQGAPHQFLDVGAGREGAVAGADDQERAASLLASESSCRLKSCNRAKLSALSASGRSRRDQGQLVDAAHVDRHR